MKEVSVKTLGSSVTRFGKISPLWHKVKKFGNFKRLHLGLSKI